MTSIKPAGRMAYFDCINGAAGDMIVAALLDAGADPAKLREGLDSLKLDGYALHVERVKRKGIAGTRFHVEIDANAKQPHRHLKDVVAIINRGDLSESVRAKSIRVFERLAEAEAAVHGTARDKVHFHEVGAVDAILDIVGTMLALELLSVGWVLCSPIPVGSGTVQCAHGVMPIPAPATARLLIGVPIAATDETGELTTPTGAAVLTTIADSFGPMPPMTVESIGYGAGSREGARRPNMIRVLVTDAAAPEKTHALGPLQSDWIVLLETNLDDVSPQIVGHCMDRLMEAGALDVYASPIQMKKWRPGVLLSAMCPPERADEFARIIFRETGSLGVRRQWLSRATLPRRIETVATEYGEIRMKIAELDGRLSTRPEFEDCKAAALANSVALREVIAAADKAWQSLCETQGTSRKNDSDNSDGA